MPRVLTAFLIALAVVSCENRTDTETGEPVADKPADSVSARVEYQGKRYDLVVLGECGMRPDGSYGTWAYTLDANGKPLPDGPQLHALSESNWSVIDFYPAIDDRVIRVYREYRDKIGFEDGVLDFDGELGAGLTERIRIRITCP
ncbi:MAG TPA: hypothetical protein ENK49_08200 [Gammaproteobacteria bacterium]|nr:hypothetical protein [Gammaproteobacteria bacterium]